MATPAEAILVTCGIILVGSYVLGFMWGLFKAMCGGLFRLTLRTRHDWKQECDRQDGKHDEEKKKPIGFIH